MTPEKINEAREWIASVRPVKEDDLPKVQELIDTLDEALECLMERVLEDAQRVADIQRTIDADLTTAEVAAHANC